MKNSTAGVQKMGGNLGGEKVSDLGLCPVVIEIALEGAHDGDLAVELVGY